MADWGLCTGPRFVGPVAIAACLYPARQHVTPANLALVFVVGIVAVAGGGRRGATVVAVAASSLSFDFFLTKPYLSLRIATSADVTTTILLLVVGLAVGELAARMRSARSQVEAGRERLGRIHGLAERIAAGEEPDFVVMAVADELRQLLFLRDCRFSHGSVTDVGARIEADGSVTMAGHDWQADKLGLPTRRVRAGGARGRHGVGVVRTDPDPGLADRPRAPHRRGRPRRPTGHLVVDEAFDPLEADAPGGRRDGRLVGAVLWTRRVVVHFDPPTTGATEPVDVAAARQRQRPTAAGDRVPGMARRQDDAARFAPDAPDCPTAAARATRAARGGVSRRH